jgi:heme-degrading monooxygenase HmoA
MMVRLWNGRVWAGRVVDFLALLSSRAMQEYPQTSGYLGAYAFQRRKSGEVEVQLASFWETNESLLAFVKADQQRARHNPEHKDLLIDPEPQAEHYELAHLYLTPAAAAGPGVIMRQWRGRVPAGKAPDYLNFLHATGFRDYAATPGNLAVYGLQNSAEGVTQFKLITLWESVAAIRKFAGEDYEKAHYYPEDKNFLLEFEPLVTHYELVLAAPQPRQTSAPQVIL